MRDLISRWQQLGHNQLIRILLTAFAIGTVLVACAFSVATFHNYNKSNIKLQGQALAASISAQAVLPLLYGSEQSAAIAVKPFLAFPQVKQIGLWSSEGRLLHSSASEGADRQAQGQTAQLGAPSWLPSNEAISGVNAVLESEDTAYWQFKQQVTLAVQPDPQTSLASLQPQMEVLGEVRVLVSKAPLLGTLWVILAGHAFLACVLAGLAFWGARALTRYWTSPLTEVQEALTVLSEGGQVAPLAEVGARELSELRATVNRTTLLLEHREQELLQVCEQAKADAQVRTEFVANVSHQIRTPLNGILGTLNLIDFAQLSDEQEGYLIMARQSGQSLLSLVSSVLDFSALSSGKIKLEKERLNLQNLVESVIALHANTEAGKGLEMACVYDCNAPVEVSGDMARIHQALNNLIGNAAKFTYSGSVQVRVKVVPPPRSFRQALLPEQKLFQIAVRDTGVGIAAAEMPTLFEPYHRPKLGPVHREYGGCGLGLAITKSLVDLMGGEIHVESLEGEGSQFSLLLPLKAMAKEIEPSELLQHFDFVYCVSDPGLNKEALLSVVQQWGLPFEWSFQLYDWERHVPSEISQHRVLVLINGVAQMQRYEVHLSQLHERFAPTVVRFYKPLAEDRVLPSVIDLHVAKPVRRELLEAEILNHMHHHGHIERHEDHRPERASIAHTQALLQERSGGVRPRILVVEDNKINQQVAQATLRKLGCDVVLAENGQIAVDLLVREQFDLIFMDCQMPVMDGFTATVKIRALGGAAQQVPIIALSANTSTEDQSRCREVGMTDFIGKPFNQQQLRDCIQKWVLDPAA